MLILLTFATPEERDKFDVLYNRYKNLLFHKAMEILHDQMLAEDAVSEAFLRIYKNLHKVDDPSSGRSAAFCATITRNVALSLLEKQKRAPVAEAVDDLQPDEFDLEESILSALSSQRIFAVLEGMEEGLRSVFVLKFAYDMSHREIGRALKISENNVTVRLHRAKKKLAVLLREEGFAHG